MPRWPDLDARVLAGFDHSGGPDSCWPWTGSCFLSGYGRVYATRDGSKTQLRAHREAYRLAHPDENIAGVVIRHSCDNPPCGNPKHLLGGTHADNVADKIARGRGYRPERCRNGHRFTPENTYTSPSTGWRQCRTCRAARRCTR